MNTNCELISSFDTFTKVKNMDRAWAQIDLENLKHNVEEIKKYLHPKCEFMAIVKANGYGHGSVEISRYLNKINVYNFAVATIDEAIELRGGKVKGDILI